MNRAYLPPLVLTALVVFRGNRVLWLALNGTWSDRLTVTAMITAVGVLWWAALRVPALANRSGITWLVSGLLGLAFLAPVVSTLDPHGIDMAGQLAGPSLAHPLGTDLLGRDFATRVLYALRTSIIIAILATTLAVAVGTVVGALAGLSRRLDGPVMRLVDAGLAFPRVFLLLALFALWESVTVPATVVILGLTGWYRTSRLVRGETLSIVNRDFFRASIAAGVPGRLRLFRHVIPNMAPILIVTWVLGVGNIMLIESGLAYLGFGVGVPTPSLGRMVTVGTEYLSTEPRLALVPGIAIGLTVVAFGLLGDRLQQALDPRLS